MHAFHDPSKSGASEDLRLFASLDPAINIHEELVPGLPRAFHNEKSAGVRFALAECAPIDSNLVTLIAERAGAQLEIITDNKVPYLEIRTFFREDHSRDQVLYQEPLAGLKRAVNEIFALIRGDKLPNLSMPTDLALSELLPRDFKTEGEINGRPRVYQLPHVAGVRFETKLAKGDPSVAQLIDFADSFGVTATVENGGQGSYWHFQVIDAEDNTSQGVHLLPIRGMINLINIYGQSFVEGTFPPSVSPGVK